LKRHRFADCADSNPEQASLPHSTWEGTMIDITRRQALAGMGSLGASIGLSACSTPITPFCPTDPTISDPFAPLTIDVHTHVFNGSDLQIDGFFRWVVLRNGQSELGAILQELGRDFAPTAAEELAALQEVDSVNRACDIRASSQVLQTYGQERYSRGKDALKAALTSVRARRARSFRTSTEIERQINDLPENYSDYNRSVVIEKLAPCSHDDGAPIGGAFRSTHQALTDQSTTLHLIAWG
jgi:hypothetical protein